MAGFRDLQVQSSREDAHEIAVQPPGPIGTTPPRRIREDVLLAGLATEDALNAEQARRASGDDLQSITVGSIGSFNAALAAQENADTPLEIVCSATFVTGGETYNTGDVVYVAPRSQAIERRFNIVRRSEFNAATRARQEGDEWSAFSFSSAATLAASLTAHADTDSVHAAILRCTAAFVTATRAYASGQRYYLAPHHADEANMVLVSEASDAAPAAPTYAAHLTVWPPNVAQNSDLQRNFKAVLNELDEQALRLEGGATGTRFANRFQIKTRNADRAEVLLHSEAWSYTAEGAQELEWNVSGAEFNQIGTEVSTDYVEVWGEFRAIYAGGVNEVRGRTQPFVIGFGEEAEWPITRGDAAQAVDNASDIGYATVASGAELDVILAAQATSLKPRLVLFTAAINNHRFQGGGPFNILANQVRYFKPKSVTGVNFFVLPGGPASGQSASQVTAAILAALPPFADIRLLPGALPGSAMPDDFYVELSDKLINREIDGLSLTIQGQTFQPHASTPLSGFDTEGQALVRFDISAQADTIANSINAADRSLIVDLVFSFTEGNDYRRRITLPVNNPLAPRLVPETLDTIPFNVALALDWLSDDMRTVTLTADVTLAFSNIQVGRPLLLEVVQDATGGKGITWPSSVEWAGGAAEGPTAAGNARDIFTLLPVSKTRVLAAALLNVS